jgi:hypothetical protein
MGLTALMDNFKPEVTTSVYRILYLIQTGHTPSLT